MIRALGMVVAFIAVLVGVLALGAVGIGVWVAYGHVGLAGVGVVAFGVALAWAAAKRVGDEARRQAALKAQRQVPREVPRKERLELPQCPRWRPASTNDDGGSATIIEWNAAARQPRDREPRLFRDPDDFTVIEWTEDRRR
jgi:hypothetical protein